jgi:hypothetical protein
LRPTLVSKVSAKRARLSGDFQSRAGDPLKRAGSRCRYVLRAQAKVKARRLRQNQDAPDRIDEKTSVG